MSNSSASGRRSAFSQTFTLLSQYVKEKKAIGDISLGMFGNCEERGQNDAFRPTTMNLFPVNQKSAGEEPILSNSRSMDLFPQQSCFASQSSEPQSSPLTIFYNGQVIVVNDFPAHKAKEIMEFANRGVSQKSSSNNIPNLAHKTGSNDAAPAMKNAVEQIQECAKQTSTPVVADLPIARKASLHRFLEKRKDRQGRSRGGGSMGDRPGPPIFWAFLGPQIIFRTGTACRIKAKAPYNTSKGGDVPLKADESNSWLGLAAAAAAPPS